VRKDAVERPRHVDEVQRLDEQARVARLPSAAAAHEAPQLLVHGPASPRRLLLERPEGAEVSLRLGHLFDAGDADSPDQLRLQIGNADEEPEPFHARAVEAGAETGPLEATAILALLAGVAETGQSFSEPCRAEVLQEAPDRLRAADRDDRNPFRREVAPATFCKRLERDPVADALDKHDRTVSACRIGQLGAVIWVYVLLVAAIIAGIWLAIVVIKWLFILAVVAGVVWLLLLVRRRVAN
jgi:hypothetical protein